MATTPNKTPAPQLSPGERVWRNTFFVLSAVMAGTALVDFDAGRFANGLGDLGASILMLSLIVQFPFVRAMVQAGSQGQGSADELRKRRESLLQQVEQVRAANPWAEHAGRAGWILLGISLLLRITGAP
jgi:hypothetical protein